jgi:MFS family permease
VVVGLTNPRVAFGADAATFLVSAVVLSRMRPIESLAAAGASSGPTPGAGFWRDLHEGLGYVARRRALVVAIASMSATTFLLLAFDTLSPLALRQLGASRSLFGFAVAALGLGGVLGAVVIGRAGNAFNPFVLLGGAKIIIGALVALVGTLLVTHAHPAPLVLLPILLTVGVAAAGVLVSAPTILQRETPPALMGRVSATANAVPTVFQIAAPIVGAAVAAWQSVGFVFAVAGAGLAVSGFIVVLLRPPVGVDVGTDAGRSGGDGRSHRS